MFIRELYYFLKVFKQSNYNKLKKEELQLFFSKNIINHAYENNFFYRNLYKKHGFHPRDFKTLQDFKKIPIIRKKDIIKNIKNIINENNKEKYKIMYTSGTTGNPFSVYLDEETNDYTNCIFTRSLIEQGYNPFKKLGFYWYRKEQNSFFNNLNLNRKYIINYSFSPKKQFDLIKKNKLRFLYYFPFKLYELANSFSPEKLRDLKIKRIFTIGEILSKKMKLFIEDKFGCHITDNYGLTEFNIAAFQKTDEQEYYVNDDNIYLESIQNREKFTKNIRKSLITSFSNFFMPFIRYETEDYLELDKNNNICRILGKKQNFFVLDNKIVHISSLIDLMVDFSDYIFLFRFEISKKTLKIILSPKKTFSKNIAEKIVSKIKNLTNYNYTLVVVLVKKIEFEKRGKLNLIINKD